MSPAPETIHMTEVHDSIRPLVERLATQYPTLERHELVRAAASAMAAIESMSLGDDADAADLVAMMTEREVRLRLGLDREAMRLDPERRMSAVESAAD
jgi:hypothetical protein